MGAKLTVLAEFVVGFLLRWRGRGCGLRRRQPVLGSEAVRDDQRLLAGPAREAARGHDRVAIDADRRIGPRRELRLEHFRAGVAFSP